MGQMIQIQLLRPHKMRKKCPIIIIVIPLFSRPIHPPIKITKPASQAIKKKERAHRNRLEFLDFFQSMNGWNPQAKPSGSWATQISHRFFSHAKSKHMFVGCKRAGKDQGKCWHKRLLVLTFFVWSLLPTQRSIPRAKGKIIAQKGKCRPPHHR